MTFTKKVIFTLSDRSIPILKQNELLKRRCHIVEFEIRVA